MSRNKVLAPYLKGKPFKGKPDFICELLDLEPQGPAELPHMQGPEFDYLRALPTLNEDGTTVDEVPYTSEVHKKLLDAWAVRESAQKQESLVVHTRIRYEPDLAELCSNDREALNESEDGFFLVKIHLKYLNFAAHSLKWPLNVKMSYEKLLSMLNATVNTDAIDKSLPHEIKVSLDRKGTIEIEAFEVEPRYHLYQGLLEYYRDDAAARAVAGGELPETFFAIMRNGGYGADNQPVDMPNGFTVDELDPSGPPPVDRFLESIPERFRNFSTVPEHLYDIWIDTDPIAASYFTTFYTNYDAPHQRSMARTLSESYPGGIEEQDRVDVILYNGRYEIMNGTEVCIAVKRYNTWVTPYICAGGVCDVMRTFLLERGLIFEADISIHELYRHEYLLVFNPVIGIMRGIVANHPPEPIVKRKRKPKESQVIRRSFDDIIEDEQDAGHQSKRLQNVAPPRRTRVRGAGILRF